MTTQHTAEALAPKLYAAYIESTGRLSYRGSSVLGLKDASAIDEMGEDELWSALKTLKMTTAPPAAWATATASVPEADRLTFLRGELASAIVCPAWEDLSEPVKRAWVASALEALRLTAEAKMRDIDDWLAPAPSMANLPEKVVRERLELIRELQGGRMLVKGEEGQAYELRLPGDVGSFDVPPQGRIGHLRHHLELLKVADHVLAAEAIVNGQAIAGPGGQPPMSVEFRLVLADNAPDDLRQTIALAIRRSMMFGWVTWGTDCLGEVKLEGWPEARPVYATILKPT